MHCMFLHDFQIDLICMVPRMLRVIGGESAKSQFSQYNNLLLIIHLSYMSIDGNYFGTYLAFKLLFHVKAVKFSIKYFMLEKKNGINYFSHNIRDSIDR